MVGHAHSLVCYLSRTDNFHYVFEQRPVSITDRDRQLPLIISVILLIMGIGIVFPDKIGICNAENWDCILKFPIFELGRPLIIGSFFLVFISIVTLFLRQEVFKTWSKFAMVAIPLGAILIALTPVQSSSGAIAGLGIGEDRESVTWIASIVFLVISLLIVAIKSYKLRKT